MMDAEELQSIVSAFLFVILQFNQTGDLVAFYPFSGNANDVSGFNNNGTVSGASLALIDGGILQVHILLMV